MLFSSCVVVNGLPTLLIVRLARIFINKHHQVINWCLESWLWTTMWLEFICMMRTKSSNWMWFLLILACSRKRHSLEAQGRIDVTLHCTSNGNYEELQCDSGICWCANARTGEVVHGSRAMPETMWTLLPCCKSIKQKSMSWSCSCSNAHL